MLLVKDCRQLWIKMYVEILTFETIGLLFRDYRGTVAPASPLVMLQVATHKQNMTCILHWVIKIDLADDLDY